MNTKDDVSFPVCRQCGCNEFIVNGKVSYSVTFHYDEHGEPIVFGRDLGDSKWYERIYCEKCGCVVGKRSIWESQGLEVPI